MISWLLAFIPAPWLVVLKDFPWRLIGYLIVAAATALLVLRILVWHDFYRTAKADLKRAHQALQDERDCVTGTSCAKRLTDWQRDGKSAVEKALQTAHEAATAQQEKLDAEHARETERLMAAASAATDRENAWRRKYAAAIAKPESACARWAGEVVPCPVE